MRLKKYLKIVNLLVVFALLFTIVGCNSSSGTSAKPAENSQASAAAPQKTVELAILIHSLQNWPFFDEVIKDFESKNPGIKVTMKSGQHVDSGTYPALLQSSGAPDVLLLGSGAGRIMPLAQAGLIDELSEVYKSRGWDKTVQPSLLEAIKKYSGGKVYEISNGMDVFTIKYHKSLFTKYNLKAPTNYQDFLKVMQSLKDAGQLPMAVGVKDGVMGGWMISAFWQASCGADFVGKLLYGDASFTDPKSVKAAEEFYNFMKKGYLNSDCTALSSADSTAIFATKKAATMLMLQSYLDQYIKDGTIDINDIGSFAIPSMDPAQKGLPIAGLAQTWVISSASKQKEAAYKWIDYVVSQDYVAKLAEKDRWAAGIGNIVIKDVGALKIGNPIVKDAFEQLKDGVGYNCSPYLLGTLKTTYFECIQNMLSGVITPEQAMSMLQKQKDAMKK